MPATPKPIQSSFLAGESSPRLWCRPDVPGYYYGARQLENYMVLRPGVFTRRPGLLFVAKAGATAAGENAERLVRFVYSSSDSYQLGFGPSYIHFYRNKAKITSGGNTVSVTTTYTATEIWDLQFYQSADVIYITHPSHFPAKLVRTSHTAWALSDCAITDGPFLTENTTQARTVTPSALTGSITVSFAATTPLTAANNGDLLAIRHVMPRATKTGAFSGAANSDSIFCPKDGQWELSLTDTTGASTTTIEVQFSLDGGSTWGYTARYQSAGTVTLDRTARGDNQNGQNVLVRVSCTAHTSGTIQYELTVPDYVHTGIVRLVGVNVGTLTATATVITDLGLTDATHRWAEGAWGSKYGRPKRVGFNGNRLLFGNTAHQPLTLWGSVVGEYEKLATGETDADAWAYTISRAQQNPIQWICGEQSDAILLGTMSGVLQLVPVSAGPLTYSNPPKVGSSDATPCSADAPALVGSTLLFLNQTAESLHVLVYNDTEASVVAQDLTFRADHLGTGGLSQLCAQNTKSPIVWALRGDGQAVGWSIDRAMGMVAPWRVNTAGDDETDEIVSISTNPAADGGYDEFWCCVKRTINGSVVYLIEVMADVDLEVAPKDGLFLDAMIAWDGGGQISVTTMTAATPAVLTLAAWPASSDGVDLANSDNVRLRSVGELDEEVFVVANANKAALTLTLKALDGTAIDGSLLEAYTSGGTLEWVENTFTGVTHLASTTADVLADGLVSTVAVSGAGQAVLADYAGTVRIGLHRDCIYQSLPVELGNGSTLGRSKRMPSLGLVVDHTLGGQYGISLTDMKDITYRITGAASEYPQSYTGSLLLEGTGGFKAKDLFLYLRQTQPFPMTVCAIAPELEVV